MLDLSKALHIVGGYAAASCLKAALHLNRDQLLVNEDSLSYGPIPATADLNLWRATRESFNREMDVEWPDFSFDAYADQGGLLTNAARLGREKTVVVWVGLGVPDQLLLAWTVFLLDQQNVNLSKLRIVQFERLLQRQTVLSMGELNPESIRTYMPEPRQLDSEEVDELRRAWRVYTSDDPAVLARYVADRSSMPTVYRALSRFLYRYPDARSGLGVWDERLLHRTSDKGPAALRVIGYTMGESCDTLDLQSDTYLFYRMLKLARGKSPLLSLTGDVSAMRDCEVRLTPFGRKVLEGEANAVHENGIDDWIGGVHLGTGRPVTFRREETLVLD